MISAIVLTFNEEKNLHGALDPARRPLPVVSPAAPPKGKRTLRGASLRSAFRRGRVGPGARERLHRRDQLRSGRLDAAAPSLGRSRGGRDYGPNVLGVESARRLVGKSNRAPALAP